MPDELLIPDSQGGQYDEWHPFWDVSPLERFALQSAGANQSDTAAAARYSLRWLRYWFMYHLIHKEYFALRRPLDICEVGVGNGAMLSFVRAGDALSEHGALPGYLNGWDAVSRNIDESRLTALGYSRCLKKNIEETDIMLPRQYDVMILLHILEHLYDPEKVFEKLLPFLREGGLVIGGFPGLPEVFCRAREQRIRKTAQRFGHVSVFSPKRVAMMAKRNSLRLEMLTGAYLFRSTGFILERFKWWVRLNLCFGALLPAWPGEIYWSMRKPATTKR